MATRKAVFLSGRSGAVDLKPAEAGALHGSVVKEFLQVAAQSRGKGAAVHEKLIAQLQADGAISPADTKVLRQVSKLLLDKEPTSVSLKMVKSIFDRASANSGSSSVTVAILGIAVNSLETAANNSQGTDRVAKGVAANDLGGALGGATIGSKTGGIWGGVLGGLVGGAGASYLANKDNEVLLFPPGFGGSPKDE